MTERFEERRHTTDSTEETQRADKLAKDLAVQNGDVVDSDSPKDASFSKALRAVVAEARSGRQRMGDEIDFESQFRNKLTSLATPGELELSLVSISHLGESTAFIPIIKEHSKLDAIERFLERELKLDQATTRQIVKSGFFSWRGKGASESLTVLPVTEEAAPWLRQILKDNSDIPGAHVGLALSRKNGEVHIGLSISLEPLQSLPINQPKENAKSDSKLTQMFSRVKHALGPLVGMAQNAGELILNLYCVATARRMGVETVGSLTGVHRFVALVYTIAAAPQMIDALLYGSPFNPSTFLKYCLAVTAINLCSRLFEKGRARYLRSIPDPSKKIRE